MSWKIASSSERSKMTHPQRLSAQGEARSFESLEYEKYHKQLWEWWGRQNVVFPVLYRSHSPSETRYPQTPIGTPDESTSPFAIACSTGITSNIGQRPHFTHFCGLRCILHLNTVDIGEYTVDYTDRILVSKK